ncbi:unnamed protein product [Urochloa decumbens]|uniref:Uncharacterized protein n=1 Tax=Urochloa decumbens TaxID=240449 RepID=A0ABC8Z0X4_9POAL
MDVSAFVALLLFIALISLLLLFAATTRKGSTTSSRDGRRLPPSPPGLPLLGHLPLLGPLPHRALRAMAATHGPVMLLRLGRVPTVVVSSAAAAQEVMKTRDLAFASRPRVRMAERLLYGRDMAFAPYGERWRQARRVAVLHLLSHRRVREQEAAAMVDRVRRGASSGGGAVNLNAVLISYTNGIISRAAFGDDDRSFGFDGGEKLAKVFAEFEELLGTVTMGEFVPWLGWVDTLTGLDARTARMAEEMDALVERVVADHRRRRRRRGVRREADAEGDDDHRDFVDVLLDVNEAEEQTGGGGGVLFDDVAIKAMVLVMFAAATDTTYTALVWAMAELVNHPNEMRRVQDEVRAAVAAGDHAIVTEDHLDELRYLKCVIKETLRLHAPLPLLLPHETTEDTELLGYHVPARTRVIVNAWAIARDPAAWERPDEFVPERWLAGGGDDDYMFAQDFRLVPFGAGRRGCPGVGFALPSMELALASLLYHFDWELPAGGASKLEMDELNGLSVRLKATLNLVAKQWSR